MGHGFQSANIFPASRQSHSSRIDLVQVRLRALLANGPQNAAGERPVFQHHAQRLAPSMRNGSQRCRFDKMTPQFAGLALPIGKAQ